MIRYCLLKTTQLEMKNIIVTGGLGFIGTNLINFLLKKKYRVLNLDKFGYSSNNYLVKNKSINNNYKFIKINIATSPQEILDSIVRKFKPDYILNLAAESHVDRSIVNPYLFLNENINLTTKILCAALNNKQSNRNLKIIHIGTDEVYGDISLNSNYKFNENSKLNPNNPYSASKASCNTIVRSFNKTFGLKTIIINPSNNYGPFQLPEKLIPKSIFSVFNKKPIEIYGKGKNMRNWIHVSDTVSGILFIMKKGIVGMNYNICSKDCLSNIDLITILSSKLQNKGHKKIQIKFVKDRLGHDLKYNMTCKNLLDAGWYPQRKLNYSLDEVIDWYSHAIKKKIL